MKKIKYLIIFAVIISIYSCSQNDKSIYPSHNTNNKMGIQIQNPREFIGINHNLMTEAIYNILLQQNLDTTFVNSPQYMPIITHAVIQAGNSTNLFVNLDSISLFNTLSTFNLNWNNLTFLDSLMNYNIDNYMTLKESYYVLRIINYLQTAYINKYDLTTIQDSIMDIETDILNQTWGTNEDKALDLISQTKYSYNLSISIFGISNSINFISKKNNSILEIVKGNDAVRGVLLADAAGYIGGAAGGTVVLPGGGTVVGAVMCGTAMSGTAISVISTINTVAGWLGFK